MLIQKKRIKAAAAYTKAFKKGQLVAVVASDPLRFKKQLLAAGFTDALAIGEVVLPSADSGPIAEFNAEGKDIVRKDLPKETAYAEIVWRWKEWRGRYDYDEKEEIRYRPYERWPREFVPPPSLELQLVSDAAGNPVVASRTKFTVGKNDEDLMHAVNLFLEMFGECELRDEELVPVLPKKLQRLNWKILPPGEYPWERLSKALKPIVEQASEGNQYVIFDRLETLSKYGPDFVAVGTGGFHGYVVFGFPKKNLFVMDSAYYGNATYVFDKGWEEMSQLTKAEVLSQALQKARLIHVPGWRDKLRRMLG